jgi:hypothetical protein
MLNIDRRDSIAFLGGSAALAGMSAEDVIGRHFKQPKEGLGFDGSSVAHMWRTAANPDNPL